MKKFYPVENEDMILSRAKALRARDVSWNQVAARMGTKGVTVHWLRCKLEEGYREKVLSRAQARKPSSRHTVAEQLYSRPISDEELARIRATMPRDTRDLTARVCGDPLPGRSALDKKRGLAST